MSTTKIFLGLLFGSIGMGFMVYGKKQRRIIPWVSGIGLCVLPYLIPNVIALVLVSIGLIALPFVIRD